MLTDILGPQMTDVKTTDAVEVTNDFFDAVFRKEGPRMRNGGSLCMYSVRPTSGLLVGSRSPRSMKSPKGTVAQRMVIGQEGHAPGPERKARRTGNPGTRPLGAEF